MNFPTGKYEVIYADPPWHFGGGGVFQDGGRAIRRTDKQYRLMKLADIKALPVESIASDDALLFLWTTDQHLPDALELMTAWGFRYSTVAFYWVKRYESGALCSNVGCWTMKNCEMVLLGIRGKPLRYKNKRNVKQLVEAVRGRHSEKPAEVRHRIEELCGDVRRIELFARTSADGWDCWGDEAPPKRVGRACQ